MTNPWNDPEKPEANNPWAPKENNPWDQAQDAAPPTVGWGRSGEGSRQAFHEDTDSLGDAAPVEATPRKKSRVGGFLIGLIMILALAIIAAVAWLYLSGRIGGGDQEQPGEDDGAIVQTVDPSAEENDGSVTDEAENTTVSASSEPSQEVSTTAAEEDEEAGATARSVERRPSAEPVAPDLPEAAQSAGLTLSGWSDNAATRCNNSEELVYAGRDSDAWITVCEANGQMTYRSDIFGGTLTATVDQSRSNPSQGEFYVDAAPSIIEVVGGGVEVFQGGTLVAEKSFPSAWVLD